MGQPIDAKLLTPEGWIFFDQVKVGDQVIGSNGKPCNVTGVFSQGVKPVYEVLFQDGARTQCGLDHPWLVRNRSWTKPKATPHIRTLGEVVSGGLVRASSRASLNYIPLVEPVQFTCREVQGLDPYLLGALIANGCFVANGLVFSSFDLRVVEKVKGILVGSLPGMTLKERALPGAYSVRGPVEAKSAKGSNFVRNYLREVGLLGKGSASKFVPAAYMLGSIQDRLLFLQGLLDCDSYERGGRNNTEWTTASLSMRDDVRFIVRSLGGSISTWKDMQSKGRREGERETVAYRTCLSFPEGVPPLSLPTRVGALKPRKKRLPYRCIREVSLVGYKGVVAISLDSKDSLYATDDFILTMGGVS